jgi:SAM-dependent methyltransferase
LPPGVRGNRPSIRGAYAAHPDGAGGFYAEEGASYRNPHEAGVRAAIARVLPELGPLGPDQRILDLCCGSGEVTLALRDLGVPACAIDGADPFTGEAYRTRTGATALPWAFADLPAALDGRRYAAIVCSMALHLCEPSRLPEVCLALAEAGRALVIVTPHKRPVIRSGWGWTLVDERLDPEHRLRTRRYARQADG